jgi:hypothetical protein
MRGNDPTIAWFKDPAGNILSVLEATMRKFSPQTRRRTLHPFRKQVVIATKFRRRSATKL